MTTEANIGWHFWPGDGHGIHPGLETFAADGNPKGKNTDNLIREIIQNSLDARRTDSDRVKITFEIIESDFDTCVPDPKLIQAGIKEITTKNDQVPKFAKHAQVLKKYIKPRAGVKILKVSDEGTRGLEGDDWYDSSSMASRSQNNSAYQLLRAEGQSGGDKGRGGSYGFGKFAPFNFSELLMIFYGSLNSKNEIKFAGKVIWPSFSLLREASNPDKRGQGDYGQILRKNPKNDYDISVAIDSIAKIESDYWSEQIRERQRRGPGLDLHLMGFSQQSTDWYKSMLQSALIYFWMAIYRGELEISFIDQAQQIEILIDQDRLGAAFDAEIHQTTKKDDSLRSAYAYYRAVSTTQPIRKEIGGLGECQLYIDHLAPEDEAETGQYPNKVAFMRQPKMMIYDKHYSLIGGHYAAVFICENDSGNQYLRDLEPPRHHRWNKTKDKQGFLGLINEFINQQLDLLRNRNPVGFFILNDFLSLASGPLSPTAVADIRVMPVADRTDRLRLVLRALDADLAGACLQAENDKGAIVDIDVASVIDESDDSVLYRRLSKTGSDPVVLTGLRVGRNKSKTLIVELINESDRYRKFVLSNLGDARRNQADEADEEED